MSPELKVIDEQNKNLNQYGKILDALDTEKEIHIMRGLVTNVEQAAKESTGEIYYIFDLKVLKQFGNDSEYGQSYNLYNIIVPANMMKSPDEMSELKGNEVIAICETRCSVRTSKTESKNKFNSISFFTKYLELSRVVNRVQSVAAGTRKKL